MTEFKSPSDLEQELKIARDLLKIAVDAKLTSQANSILQTIGRLAKIYDDLLVRSSKVLSEGAAQRLAQDIGRIILEELEAIDDWRREEILDRIMDRIADSIDKAKNTKTELNSLIGRDH